MDSQSEIWVQSSFVLDTEYERFQAAPEESDVPEEVEVPPELKATTHKDE